MASAVNLAYVYQFPSAVEVLQGRRHLKLATSGGVQQNPYFFKGKLIQPRMTADMLLCVSLISRTRFFDPTAIRERMLAAADPVVTSGGDRLRFEAFSVCCGAYARLDLKPDAVDGQWVARGTTNVDFNAPMRTALTALLNSEQVGINVGVDTFEVERRGQTVVERKVKLPVRWLKGFVEVQAYQAGLKAKFEVSGPELKAFLRTLPAHSPVTRGSTSFILPSGKSLRLSQREASNAVRVGAPGRLKVLEEIIRHAKSVRVYASDAGVSDWEIVVPEGSFHLVLSPEAWRGFSGEGQALSQLALRDDSEKALSSVRAALQWQSKIDESGLCAALNLDKETVHGALSALGTRGLVGFDIAENAYFHRELPFDLSLVEDLQPRLQKARTLLEEKAVKIAKKRNDVIDAFVKGTEVEHRVLINEDTARCTCPWYTKHPGERGPCSHILAVEILAQQEEENEYSRSR
jgi:hypothetical protein